jgi:hypothetical protein
VGDVAHHLAPQPLGFSEAVGHRVEDARQVRDLVAPVGRDTDGQLAAGHAPGGSRESADRLQDAA